MKRYFLLFPFLLFAFDNRPIINEINTIETIYNERLKCLETDEAATCIRKYPQDPKSDALAKTFSMAFPKSYYAAKLRRDLKILEQQKICVGRAMSEFEAKECLKNR